MMKNKGVTYALLIVVALIWYQVFFRVKSNLFGEETVITADALPVPAIASLSRDTFRLRADYRDPFSGIPETTLPTVAAPPAPQEARLPLPSRQETWPEMIYYGLIQKTGSKVPLAILKVDNMQFYLHRGESVFDNYVVKRIFRDSIEVVHGRKRRMVYKGK